MQKYFIDSLTNLSWVCHHIIIYYQFGNLGSIFGPTKATNCVYFVSDFFIELDFALKIDL